MITIDRLVIWFAGAFLVVVLSIPFACASTAGLVGRDERVKTAPPRASPDRRSWDLGTLMANAPLY